MTVTTTVSKVTFSANGVTTVWPFAFLVPTADDVEVIVTSALGVESTISQASYSITGLDNPAGGTVTYPTSGSPLAAGNKLTVRRKVGITQSTDLVTGASFYAEDHERVFDRAAMIDQQQQEQLDRSLKFPVSDGPLAVTLPVAANRAGKGIKFDGSGNVAVTDSDIDQVVSSAQASAATAAAQAGIATAQAATATARATEAADSAATAQNAAGNNIRGIAPERAPAAWMLGALAFLDKVSTALITGLGALATKSTVGSADIDADAVTLAKLEHGTQGDVLYYGAAGAPARLGAGAAGQALTSGGAGANPAWAYASHVQRVPATNAAWTTITDKQIPGDDSAPQNTEGEEILTCSITPKSAAHILRVTVLVPWQCGPANRTFVMALFQDGGADAKATTWNDADASTNYNHQFVAEFVAGTEAETTIKLRVGFAEATGTMYLNGGSGGRFFGGSMKVQMFVDEFKA